MPLPRRVTLPIPAERPTWITTGMLRLATLSAFVIAIGMTGAHLSRTSAWFVVVVGGSILTVAAAAMLGLTTRLASRLALPGVPEVFLLALRRTGLPLLGLVFFLTWTLVYVALWALHPVTAFQGMPPRPRFADFFYYAVCTAFVSPPGDLLARSRGTRTATMIEMMTAFALLTAYLSSFVDWQRRDA